MHFVDADRSIERVVSSAGLHPVLVLPAVVQVPDHRRGFWRNLIQSGKGIGLDEDGPVIPGSNMELVQCSDPDAGDESFPNAGRLAGAKRMAKRVPMIERPEDRDLCRLRRPHGKISAFDSLEGCGMRSELLVEMEVGAFIKEVQVIR